MGAFKQKVIKLLAEAQKIHALSMLNNVPVGNEKNMLTQDELKTQLNYDSETGIFTRLIAKSRRVKIGDIAGSLTNDGYFLIMINNSSYLSHRLAWLYITGSFPNNYIDHINGNKGDNRFCNLRDVNFNGNQQNIRKARVNNKSGLLGVSKEGNKWRAQITVNKICKFIGLFDSKESAHNAYLESKRQLHTTCSI